VAEVSDVLLASKPIVGTYLRVSVSELAGLESSPSMLLELDIDGAFARGVALDLGRGWEPLAVWIDGGVRLPEQGPTLGEVALPDVDPLAAWSYVDASRVPLVAQQLTAMCRGFAALYARDGEDTDPYMSDGRTGGYRGNRDYLMKKLEGLARHYGEAAQRGEAILVRIGERR
jgi:hypothetical protein